METVLVRASAWQAAGVPRDINYSGFQWFGEVFHTTVAEPPPKPTIKLSSASFNFKSNQVKLTWAANFKAS